jgi:hypothetical protein
MSKRHGIWSFAVLLLALSTAWGQDNSAQQPADTQPAVTPQQPPVPAYGPDNAAPAPSDNPPISGVDMPNLQPHAAPLSYLQAGAHVSESVDSNIENTLGGSAVNSITRALGSVDLQRLWSHYDLSLDYLGGIGYYNAPGLGLRQIEELGLTQKINWKRGELGIRDAFSYQPEGTFGSAYGSVGATGAGLGGLSAFFGGTELGALGQVPRIMNLTLVDVVESLSPKSSITATAGYGFVHFLQNQAGTDLSFIGSSQVSAQVGYDRVLGPHDQIALVYGYQGFDFSTGVNFHSNIIQVMWGHRISGRMDFLLGVGPQFTQINDVPVEAALQDFDQPGCALVGQLVDCLSSDFRIGAAGRASLRYQFPKLGLNLTYQHFLTSGSGFFAGAESDIASLGATRPLSRVWDLSSDLGYSRNSRLATLTSAQLTACTPITGQPPPPACPGTSADVYSYEFAGVAIHRMFGRTLHAYASYQFNFLTFDDSYCGGANVGPCDRISRRSVGTIGLDWTPRPVRLD